MDAELYLNRGFRSVQTESSVLVSSSKYLNDPRLRDWIATESLRRNGPDLPGTYGVQQLLEALAPLWSRDRINALFAAERVRNARLDAWFSERFISRFTAEDLAVYPKGSIARIFHDFLVSQNLQAEILPSFEPHDDYDYFVLRAQQTHDFEHILGGFQANAIGEMGVIMMRIANFFTLFSPELAGELSIFNNFLLTACLNRTVLHYPECWPAFWDAVEQGARVGRASGPFFMAKYEELFHLTPEIAREKIGVRLAVDLDTQDASAAWSG